METTNYMQIAEQTHEEKIKMYMKFPKKKLVEMLIECNRHLSKIKPNINDDNRKEKRIKFIEENKALLFIYRECKDNYIMKNIAEKARKEIGYSKNTANVDIVWSLSNYYYK